MMLILFGQRARRARRALDLMDMFRQAIRNRPQISQERVMEVLGSSRQHPLYDVLHQLLDAQAVTEAENAVRPSIGDENRHYNAGRAASIQDFQVILEQMQADAEARLRSLNS